MAKVKINVKAFERRVKTQLQNGILAGVQRIAELYKDDVTQFQSPPTSIPGEFPHKDTKVASRSIGYKLDGELSGYMGLLEENEGKNPLIYMIQKLRLERGRLGPDNTTLNNVGSIRLEAETGLLRTRAAKSRGSLV